MQDYRPSSHFGMRREENKLFAFMRQITVSDGTEPVNSILSATFGGEGSQKSSIGVSLYLKKKFKVSKEVKVGVSGKFKLRDGMPTVTDPAVEMRHSMGSSQGSSVIITRSSLAIAHMRRLTRQGNFWLSGLLNLSFQGEVLTPAQLSVCGRFHPSGSEFLDNSVATVAFDTTHITKEGDFLKSGIVSLTLLTQLRKDLKGAIQLMQATGSGDSSTVRDPNAWTRPTLKPVLQAGLSFHHKDTRLKVTALVEPTNYKTHSEASITLDHYIASVKLHTVANVGICARDLKRPKWSVGAYVDLDEVLTL